jgi:ABC-type dipeptide/oligopeptide/nickel transport system permease component
VEVVGFTDIPGAGETFIVVSEERMAKQIGLYLLALWAAMTLNFILPRLMPGDPVTALFARMRGRLNPAEIEAIRVAYGFTNAPLIEQYFPLNIEYSLLSNIQD